VQIPNNRFNSLQKRFNVRKSKPIGDAANETILKNVGGDVWRTAHQLIEVLKLGEGLPRQENASSF
jgi:hypothetical protein